MDIITLDNLLKQKTSDDEIMNLLYQEDFKEKHQLSDYQLLTIYLRLSEATRINILMDEDITINKLKLGNNIIYNLVKGLSSEDIKKTMLEKYEFCTDRQVEIILTFSSKNRENMLLNDKTSSKYSKSNMIRLLSSLDINTLIEFLKNHKEFCNKNDIHPYEIIRDLESESQEFFVTKLKDISLTLNEKREILAMLHEEVKQNLDTTGFPEIYLSALSIETSYYGIESIDFERDLKDYEGLDNLIRIEPEGFTEKQRDKFLELCKICPDLQVLNNIPLYSKRLVYTSKEFIDGFVSTTREYIEGEKWITSIINKLKPEYSNAQKMAVIDNAIGIKLSYSPDANTEVCNEAECRALWKVICSGYGSCDIISYLERYMLSRVGVKSEVIGNEDENHAFLKIYDIELPFVNEKIVKGNTILDPTWNLTAHRFAGKPYFFCISYEEARKGDIDRNGKDQKSHKNDEKLKDATVNLDDKSLRKLFASVGLANQNGEFPIKALVDKSKIIHQLYANQPLKNIEEQFVLLSEYCPKFATCQSLTMQILNDIILDDELLNYRRCVINRAYNRADKSKRPVLVVYFKFDKIGEKFYYADINQGAFIELPKEKFLEQFEAYETDIKNNNGIRPWEEKKTEVIQTRYSHDDNLSEVVSK